MSTPVFVTDHARQRWLERIAPRLGIHDVDGVARSAWNRGRPTRRSKRNSRGERRIYLGCTFVFDRGPQVVALLTVIPPPHG